MHYLPETKIATACLLAFLLFPFFLLEWCLHAKTGELLLSIQHGRNQQDEAKTSFQRHKQPRVRVQKYCPDSITISDGYCS